ncbi:MAG: helix-turn-helix transcriptional regulator [Cystobacter sp.]
MIPEELMKVVGQAAREARERLDMNQAEVARAAGISAVVYGRIERGMMLPAVPTLRKIATALGISTDVLLGLSPKEVARTLNEPPPEVALGAELRKLLRVLRAWPEEKVRFLARMAKLLDSPSVKVEFTTESEPED